MLGATWTWSAIWGFVRFPNLQLIEHQKKIWDVPVIGGADCSQVSETPSHKSTFNVGSIKFTALHTPCHTQDSICFFAEDGEDRAVFTGDTLFIGGCGRFFEGTPEQMHTALNEILASLPDDTKVYPGHEYTKGNVKFAKTILNNDAIKRLDEFSQANKETQGKFTIGDEKVWFQKTQVPYIWLSFAATQRIYARARSRSSAGHG